MHAIRIDFDALDFVKKARELGISEPVAEFQARQFTDQLHQIERVIEQAVSQAEHFVEEKLNARDLATKKDIYELKKDILRLEKEIELVRKDIEASRTESKKDIEVIRSDLRQEIANSKNQIIIWVSGIMGSLLIASGLIQHFIK